MSVRKLTASVLTTLMMLAGSASIQAQEFVPPAEPFEFDPDFRWFEPVYEVDIDDIKAKKRANTGWFATYDRLNLYTSRPELDDPNVSEVRLDSGWGHRYELGYMLPDDDTGWYFSWIDMGVGQFNTVQQEALNRYNGDQVEGGSGGGFPVSVPFGRIVPQYEANNIGYDTRFYNINDTQNVLSFDSYELNKTWRMEPYHYGGILEPMVGLRWFRIKDTEGFQTYDSFGVVDVDGNVVAAQEQITTNNAITENEMLAAQLGFRYFKYRGRFLYSGQFRVFTGGNWQTSFSQVATETYTYDNPVVIGAPMTAPRDITKTTPFNSRNEEWFVGFDARAELNYQLTKMITVRGGFALIDIAKGVWRGGDGTVVAGGDNDQDLLMVGGTFGITLNR